MNAAINVVKSKATRRSHSIRSGQDHPGRWGVQRSINRRAARSGSGVELHGHQLMMRPADSASANDERTDLQRKVKPET